AVIDVRTSRIPNWLVFAGALYGLAYNAISPLYARDIGILFALGGLAVGLAALLPAYLFRVMGAGDVKLMAMVGAFLGAWATVGAVLATLVAGGVLAIAVALWSGRTVRMLRNVAAVSRGTVLALTTGMTGLAVHDGPSAGKMPYGVAIAAGTIAYLVLSQLGFVGSTWS
ncbi:MAG TPA: A24 family peptidase, partial [Pseudolabrys sp.]|nr:A24 family peptidase [Pseudolabrys sp.]